MRKILEAKDLYKSYFEGEREVAVLRGLNLEVDKGEMVFIMGPSGAGKSTLLHLLGALDKPTAGDVRLNRVNLYQLKERERAKLRNKKVGFVFQFYYLLPEFSAWENVLMPALIAAGSRPRGEAGSAVIKEKAMGMLREVGLEERVNHRPSQLSGGEEQRVAIARALINDPEIVFADEPTGNLDEENSRSLMQLLRKLNERKKQTFVIATHQEGLAEKGERLIRIEEGKMVEESR